MNKNKPFLKLCYLITALLFMSINIYAQEETEGVEDFLDFDLESIMEMTVVSASRHAQKIIDSPRAISVITAEELRAKNYRTTPEALAELVGVHLQETNYGGGSPIIRGLVGNQILIMVDGVRINNGITRLGPNQYLNTIDIKSIEQIEVVRGAGSVLYGSDALGGLINIITKSGVKLKDGSEGNAKVSGRYSTADDGIIGRVELGSKLGDFNLFGGATVKKFNDMEGGKDTGLQEFTGYNEWNADLKLGFTPSEQHSLVLGYQHLNMSDVPRSDRLIAGADLKRHWDPELRDLVFVDYNFNNVTSFIDNINVKVSYQSQLEEIHRITSSSPNTERKYTEKVNSVGATLQLSSSIGESNMFTYGLDMNFDDISSKREDLDLTTGTVTQKAGNYADGSTNDIIALFIQDEIKLSEKWFAYLGLRYSSISVKAVLEDSKIGAVDVNITPNSLVGSGFLMYKFTPGFNISLGASQGFRAPNIDDATKLGPLAEVYNYPNPDLEPETSINYELGLKLSEANYSGAVNFFYSEISDLIALVPTTLNGKSYLDENNNGSKDDGELDVVTRGNIGESQIYGFELEGKYQISNKLDVRGNVAWTYGEDKITKNPLTRIPPLEGLFGITWKPNDNVWLEYFNLFGSKQDRLSPGDIKDIRIPDGGTPAFLTFNVRGGYDFEKYGRATLTIENITNETYKYHASGIYMPGTNFVLGYEFAL